MLVVGDLGAGVLGFNNALTSHKGQCCLSSRDIVRAEFSILSSYG